MDLAVTIIIPSVTPDARKIISFNLLANLLPEAKRDARFSQNHEHGGGGGGCGGEGREMKR